MELHEAPAFVKQTTTAIYPDYERLASNYLESRERLFQLALDQVRKVWGAKNETRDDAWAIREIRRAATKPFMAGWENSIWKWSIHYCSRLGWTVDEYAAAVRYRLWIYGHAYDPTAGAYSTWLSFVAKTVYQSELKDSQSIRRSGLTKQEWADGRTPVRAISIDNVPFSGQAAHADDSRTIEPADVAEPVAEAAEMSETFDAVNRYVEAYHDPRMRTVLYGRFGVDCDAPKRLADLGRELGVTRERARQLQNWYLLKIRRDVFDLEPNGRS